MLLQVLVASLAVVHASAIVCLPDACATVRCAAVTAENCGGEIVENGGYCGCCDACITLLAEGESCMSTLLLGVPATVQCAEGLYCDPVSHTCQNSLNLLASKKRTAALSCAESLLQIQSGPQLLGQFVPTCDTDGTYAAVQCHGSVCYCADPNGVQIPGYTVPIQDAATMDCQCARDQYAYMQTGLIGKLFYCSETGSYRRYACTGSVCYCTDESGNMKAGSPTVNIGELQSLQC